METFLITCLGLAYFILFLYSNRKNIFFRGADLGLKVLNILFAIKVVFGLISVFLTFHYKIETDLIFFYNASLTETDYLLHHPLKYFSTIFDFDSKHYSGFFYTNSAWDTLRFVLVGKFIGILNLFTFKNIYINSIVYDYFIFWGQIALYKTFSIIWPEKKLAKIIGCFFIPSSLLYLSGINKDSIFFMGMCIVIYCFSNIVYLKRKSFSLYAGLFAGLLLTLFIRNFFFIIFIPTLLAFYLSVRLEKNAWIMFLFITCIVTIIFFSFPQLMNIAVKRQAEFLLLDYAKSLVPVQHLQPNFKSFLMYFPTAVNIAFFRPYIWDSYSILYFSSAVEILIAQIIALFFIMLSFINKITISKNPIVVLCLFYSIIAFMFIGFTIPILGAVTRYRTAFLPLYLTPLLCMLPLEKMKWFSRLQNKIF